MSAKRETRREGEAPMPNVKLGILTLYLTKKGGFEERSFFRQLTVAGKKIGVDVLVFTPENIDERKKQIHAYIYDTAKQRWKRAWTGYPDLFLDRSRFYSSERFRPALLFRKRNPQLHFISSPLANKWNLYQQLSRKSAIRPYLPATTLYRRFNDLRKELLQRKLVFLKPINGTGGRGILRIERLVGGNYSVKGRSTSRRMLPVRIMSLPQLRDLVKARKPENRYIIQQGIHLRLKNGSVHDYRMLVQKDGNGKWEVTGCVGRVGAAGSVTSNLHGGGRAVPMMTLLKHWFGSKRKAESVAEDINAFGIMLVETLESIYGRLCELALDIAVDSTGHIWLIEVNTKPAREVFARIKDRAAYDKAIRRPLEYAKWLHKTSNKTGDVS